MKRLLLALGLLFCAVNAGAQTTTFNGVIKDLTGTPVPTGQVTFQLKPGIDTTISGSSRFVPATTFCEIHNPGVVSTSGTGTITVVVDTAQSWLAGDSLIFVGTADATLNANTVASPYVITVRNSSTSFVFTQSGTHTNGAGGTVGGLYKSGGTGACAVMQNSALTPANTSYTVGIQAIFSPSSAFNTYAIGSGPVDISTVVPTPSQMPSYSFMDTFSNQTIGGTKTFSGTVTAGRFNGFKFVDGAQFATCATAVADLGSTPGLVLQASGVPCPSVPANATVLDATGGTNQSLLNTISLNSRSGSGLHAMMHISETITNPTSTSDVTIYAKNQVSGTLPSGAWDGVAGDVYTIGALGAVDPAFGLQGMEGTAAVNSTGGTISNAFGIVGVVDTLAGSTTNITEAHSIHAASISKVGTGVITNAYSLVADRQIAGSTRNYSVYSKGTNLQDNGFGYDVIDLGGTPRSVVQYRSDNLTVYHPLGDGVGTGFRWSRLDGTKDYFLIDTNGVQMPDATIPLTVAGQIVSTKATGTAPLTVASTTPVPNLTPQRCDSCSISTGVAADGSGFKHKRFGGVLGGTCPTAAAAGAPCTSGNLSWTTAFADNSYTVVCTLNGSMTGQPHIVSATYQAAGAGITLTIAADTAVAANVAAAGFVDCTAVHD